MLFVSVQSEDFLPNISGNWIARQRRQNSLFTTEKYKKQSVPFFRGLKSIIKRYLPQAALDSPWKNKQQEKMIATSLEEAII